MSWYPSTELNTSQIKYLKTIQHTWKVKDVNKKWIQYKLEPHQIEWHANDVVIKKHDAKHRIVTKSRNTSFTSSSLISQMMAVPHYPEQVIPFVRINQTKANDLIKECKDYIKHMTPIKKDGMLYPFDPRGVDMGNVSSIKFPNNVEFRAFPATASASETIRGLRVVGSAGLIDESNFMRDYVNIFVALDDASAGEDDQGRSQHQINIGTTLKGHSTPYKLWLDKTLKSGATDIEVYNWPVFNPSLIDYNRSLFLQKLTPIVHWHSTRKLENRRLRDLVKFKEEYMCFLKDTKIVTKEGLKNIQDIKVGDIVLDKDNTYTEVLNTFKYKNDEDKYKINFISLNKDFVATSDHPIYVYRGFDGKSSCGKRNCLPFRCKVHKNKSYFEGYKKTKELKKNDFVVFPINDDIKFNDVVNVKDIFEKNNLKYKIDGNMIALDYKYKKKKSKILIEYKINGDIGFIIGLYMAEGWSVTSKTNISRTTIISMKDKHLLNECSQILNNNNIENKILKGKDIYNLKILDKEFSTLLFYLCGKDSYTKKINFIPSKKIFNSIWKGAFEGDGCKNSGYYTSYSNEFISQIRYYHLIYNQRLSHTTNNNTCIKVYDTRITKNIFIHDSKLFIPVKSIEKIVNDDFVYNFETKTNSYVTEFGAVHNCVAVDSEEQFYESKLILKCVDSTLKNFLSPPDKNGAYFVGVDVASIHDFFVISIFQYLNGVYIQRHLKYIRKVDIDEMEKYCDKIIEIWHPIKFKIDARGIGVQISQNLCRKHGAVVVPIRTNVVKGLEKGHSISFNEFMHTNQKYLMNDGKVKLINDEMQIIHYTMWDYDFKCDSNEDYGHGDIVIGNGYAVLPMKFKSISKESRIRTNLSKHVKQEFINITKEDLDVEW